MASLAPVFRVNAMTPRRKTLLVSLVGLLWAGGLLAAWEEGQPARLLFPNAHFVSGRRHWQRARQPHPRDRASFVPELLDLLQASGRLELLDDGERSAHLGEGWRSAKAIPRARCSRRSPCPTARWYSAAT